MPPCVLTVAPENHQIEQNKNMMTDSALDLAALKARIAKQSRGGAAATKNPAVALGHRGIDAFLGGGLKCGEVHEIFAANVDSAGSASGFAALCALRFCTSRLDQDPGKDDGEGGGTPLLWLRNQDAERRAGRLYAPGLAELGLDPATIVLAVVRDTIDLLRGGADAACCTGLGAAVIECWGNPSELDLTASRKLVLAARASGVAVVMLRPAAIPTPSAADTRWSVRAAASAPLAANTPGAPRFEAELLRRRAGPAGRSWLVEWDRDRQRFVEPAVPGAALPLPPGGEVADRARPGIALSA